MAKDTFWFKHDSGAGRGLRLRKICHIYGHEGKGFYWDVIEVLRDQDGYGYSNKPEDLQMLASLIGAKDEAKFLNFIKDCVRFDLLFIRNNYLYSKALLDNMKTWETKKRNGSGIKAKAKAKSELNSSIREEKIIKEKKREEVALPFDSSFVPVWNRWLEFRKKSGKPYKTLDGQQSALNNLAKYTKEVAVQAIEASIRNEWQGLFPESIDKKTTPDLPVSGTHWSKTKNPYADEKK